MGSSQEVSHQPVLLKEVLEYLAPVRGKKYIDATLGLGGHSAAILERGSDVLGIEADEAGLAVARRKLSGYSALKIVKGNFKDIGRIARENGYLGVAGVLFDLGLSSWQLEYSGRGFSFQKDELLDMRQDPTLAVTAADLINGLYENELAELFFRFGEEPRARGFARAINRRRELKPIRTTKELADLLVASSGLKYWRRHPATLVFQALRIAVNNELVNLEAALPQALELLRVNGSLAVISFHSLEDGIVKRFFKISLSPEPGARNSYRLLTSRPIVPGETELRDNPRSRSAKLRVIERVI